MSVTALGAALRPDQTQRVFRAVLDAFARPGIAVTLPQTDFPPALLPVLSLADLETGIHLLEDEGWDTVVAVATSAPAATLQTAKYVTALRPLTATELGDVAVGTALSPESGATVICAVGALSGGTSVRLTGPGVRAPIEFAPAGIDSELWVVRERLVAGFPAGIDLLLIDSDGGLVGIPRSTVVDTGKAN
ncbi:phosphonate C-P lyase system protein PhnH [Nocardia sp. NPDC060256]|uniref:phosphonate C-P lyase system protein PhnH n=1 Tax=unclassified Nocardia TaxID=2637762 RepID=UPI00364F2724